MLPKELAVQFKMQALELKPTDLWDFLLLPSEFIDGWFLVSGVIAEYQEAIRENG